MNITFPKDPLFKNIQLSSGIAFFVLVGFFLSSFFVIVRDSYQAISFVSAVMVVSFIRYEWRALPGVILACIVYYSITGRHWESVVILSLITPIMPFLASKLFNHLVGDMGDKSVSYVLKTYFVLIGVGLPLLSTFTLLSVTHLLNVPPVSSGFIIYSILGTYLTHLLVTPLLYITLNACVSNGNTTLIKLDANLRTSTDRDIGYLSWLLICIAIIATALTHQNSFVLNALCFCLLVVVVSGFGRHGLVRPLIIGAITILTITHDEIYRVNYLYESSINLSELLIIVSVITTLAYLLGSQSIKHYEMAQKQIAFERIDPYTGLYNIAQLKEDLDAKKELVLIYLDITPTISHVSDLDQEGKSQLIRQLHEFLCYKIRDLEHCYRPPFTTGILGYAKLNDALDKDLNRVSNYLKKFQFYWQGTSISLMSPTLYCTHIHPDKDVEKTVSALCEQRPSYGRSVHWVDVHTSPVAGLDKLSYIQQLFKNDRFELNCQPYTNLADPNSNAHSFEVLLRIRNLDGTIVSPADFFPLINLFGFEVELDRWVVEHTFQLLNENGEDWQRIDKCSINLTAKTLGVDSLADEILSKARRYHIPLSCICFEITESSALQNEQQAIETLTQLRQAGCKIALDDFGTGYASFAYLRTLPLDVLKIDGAFIKDLPHNETDCLIVSSICSVTNDMQLETVAEFAETEAHIEILKGLGITYAQGYAVAKPRSLKSFLKTISDVKESSLSI